MKIMKRNAASILVLCAAGLWCTAVAAQQAVLGGQPVTAVPSVGSAPAAGDYQPTNRSSPAQNDDPKPRQLSSRGDGQGPSEAALEELEAGRRD